jgi:hypothetical protein
VNILSEYDNEQRHREVMEFQKKTYKEVMQNRKYLEIIAFWVLVVMLMQTLWAIV